MYFLCSFKLRFKQLMSSASFNFNLKEEDAESVMVNQFSSRKYIRLFASYHHHHICFKVCFLCLHRLDGFVWLQSIFVFSYVLIDFPFFQITSDYLISCFRWSFSGETNANLSFYVYQTIAVFCPLKVPSCSPI